MRLRTMLVGVMLVVAVVLSGTIYIGFTMHKQSIVDQEHTEVKRTAAVVAGRIGARLETTIDTVDLWTTTFGVTADGPSRTDTLDTFVDRTAFNSAATYAGNGTLLAISGPNFDDDAISTYVGTNYSGQPFVERALDGEIYISQPDRTLTGQYIVQIAAPIRDDDDRIVGVFDARFHIENRSLFANLTAAGHPEDHLTITSNGQRLFDESGVSSDAITETATVSQTGWEVTVNRPRSAIALELARASALQVGGVVIGLLSVAIMGLWISRTTISRIEKLMEALADLIAGEYRTELELGHSDEWRHISDRFTSLSSTLKQRDSQLQVLNRVLRHNLRNDMNVITARAERLLAEEEISPEAEEDVEQIHETATRLITTSEHARTLYDDLLTSPQKAMEPIDVVAVVEERVSILAPQHPEGTIKTVLPTAAWALDSAVLPIVVEEVIRNAVVHNDLPKDERQVTVIVEANAEPIDEIDTGYETRITVTDNGPGIPMVEEALLTDQHEETPVEHGSGLGVWLVNWLVDQIGGTVSVATGVDRGTTVTIHLPAPTESPDGSNSEAA
ncbi:sensor histidine kinase [Halorhabdus rudnickae]|uniref:sensor histidine kinase n=1 Tax=Halorhabdus rudnickae TaxID=1775544 RepID=UPI001083B908|nr:sensor histidine kinase [Halorhabdus rudnickae]